MSRASTAAPNRLGDLLLSPEKHIQSPQHLYWCNSSWQCLPFSHVFLQVVPVMGKGPFALLGMMVLDALNALNMAFKGKYSSVKECCVKEKPARCLMLHPFTNAQGVNSRNFENFGNTVSVIFV